MPNIDLSFAKDPNTLALAIICGMLPALAWLFFWLRENRERPRRSDILFFLFLGGVAMVVLALPIEKFLGTLSGNDTVLTVLWATTEEVLKFCIFALLLLSGSAIESPIDYPIYAMVIALGFAGFENALYFLAPLQGGNTAVLVLAGAMRFLGTTLMHAASTSLPAVGFGLAYYRSKGVKVTLALAGLALAVALHSIFNIMIVANGGLDFFQVFAVLWLITIVIMILFEWLRRMGAVEYREKKKNQKVAAIEAVFSELLASLHILPTDSAPLAELISKEAGAIASRDAARMRNLLQKVRVNYEEYLLPFGADRKKARETARTVIPDTVSAQSLGGVIAVLKGRRKHEIKEQGNN